MKNILSIYRAVSVRTAFVFASLLFTCATPANAADWSFRVKFSKQVHAEPFTGRVYVFFSRTRREPRTELNWFLPEMFISRDVKNWRPDEPITFSSTQPGAMLAFPKPLAEMPLAGYRAQAVVRFNPHVRKTGNGTGNGYSPVVTLQNPSQSTEFLVDQIVPEKKFHDTKWTKLLRVRSKLLSDFHGRDVFLQASVLLPAGYEKHADRRYPTIFTIPGFGGTHFNGRRGTPVRNRPVDEQNRQSVEFLRVRLDPRCARGHHVFADSANNGPVATALVTELIPKFDRRFRSIAQPSARFLGGHSSGGWSSLWLQVTFPDFFGGTWSTSPDPVDFRDFQRINLYRTGENMYVDADGRRRPIARIRGRTVLWYKDFADMEWTLGHGGQLHSFEAVFSPRGTDGTPLLVWDRKTGAVDTAVAKTWEKYDIRLVLERNWKTLGPKLAGKLHVFMGDTDTFYLEGATSLLKDSQKKLGSDATIEIHAGRDHRTLLSREMRNRILSEMVDAFLTHHPNYGSE